VANRWQIPKKVISSWCHSTPNLMNRGDNTKLLSFWRCRKIVDSLQRRSLPNVCTHKLRLRLYFCFGPHSFILMQCGAFGGAIQEWRLQGGRRAAALADAHRSDMNGGDKPCYSCLLASGAGNPCFRLATCHFGRPLETFPSSPCK